MPRRTPRSPLLLPLLLALAPACAAEAPSNADAVGPFDQAEAVANGERAPR